MRRGISSEWIIVLTIPLVLWFAYSVKTTNYTESAVPVRPVSGFDSSRAAIQFTRADTAAFPAIFEAAFDSTAVVSQHNELYRFRLLPVGLLYSHTGKIVVCDPINSHIASAVCDTFPIGSYSVELALASTQMGETVALSRVKFSEKPVKTWSMARWPGQIPRALKDSICYAFPVDAGLAIFADSVSNKHLVTHFDKYSDDIFMSRPHLQRFFGHTLYFDRYTVTSFQTGDGDGRYCVYTGRDAEGKICRLLVDFGFFRW
ncbi:MAG: DUF4241 domain-containing protein [Bacteroidia bacterium]|jgi:hypothetical protein|nr:DUF4241 domain-containing protein [Bacteroidia bacterium]